MYCVSPFPLKAAAGYPAIFRPSTNDDLAWSVVAANSRILRSIFVSQEVGRSMEPAIPTRRILPLPGTDRRHVQGRRYSSRYAMTSIRRVASVTL